MNDFIKAQGISFSYHVEEGQQPVSVFEDLDVTIHEGELTAVLGHNGSGKASQRDSAPIRRQGLY